VPATVSIVFLVFNRRDQLRMSLRQMLRSSDYPAELVDVIVVDNASSDGSGAMVREEFPEVRVVDRDVNCGVSGWNDGLAVATGDFVLALDDDCYLPPDGLRLAVEAAERHGADLVSFSVSSGDDQAYRFSDEYRTGLLTFWGCAVLMRRRVVEELRGYDPEIFVWANELEFMIRFFDRGFRHLHLPSVVAVHLKEPLAEALKDHLRSYRINARHFSYIIAKLLHPREAAGAFVAILANVVRDAVRVDRIAIRALPDAFAGFAHGLRHRRPVQHREVSQLYRRHFHNFASPWEMTSSPADFALAVRVALAKRVVPGYEDPRAEDRRDVYFDERARFYPTSAETLQVGAGRPA
jgi:GT2 family glycosyltransferase